jgi:hypothetical protein
MNQFTVRLELCRYAVLGGGMHSCSIRYRYGVRRAKIILDNNINYQQQKSQNLTLLASANIEPGASKLGALDFVSAPNLVSVFVLVQASELLLG